MSQADWKWMTDNTYYCTKCQKYKVKIEFNGAQFCQSCQKSKIENTNMPKKKLQPLKIYTNEWVCDFIENL